MAQSFDPSALRTKGETMPIAEHVATGANNDFGAFSISANGTLIYRTSGLAANRELVWVDRTGKRLGAATKPAAISKEFFSLSPDEKTLAMGIDINGTPAADLWLQDLGRSVLTRFTFRAGINTNPTWSPDSRQVAFALVSPGGFSTDIYRQTAGNGSGEELLLHAGVNGYPSDWSPDGKFLVYQQEEAKTGADLWLLPLGGDRRPILYLRTVFNEVSAQFSPGREDPRWMAYLSDESGVDQVYIQAVPATGAKYQISTGGGTIPHWRSDGSELYYVSADKKLMAVPVTLGASVQIGAPHELFTNAGMNGFVPARDGRFLINVAASDMSAVAPITVVTNWQAGLGK
jgi:Tol biopolymer transport system component